MDLKDVSMRAMDEAMCCQQWLGTVCDILFHVQRDVKFLEGGHQGGDQLFGHLNVVQGRRGKAQPLRAGWDGRVVDRLHVDPVVLEELVAGRLALHTHKGGGRNCAITVPSQCNHPALAKYGWGSQRNQDGGGVS